MKSRMVGVLIFAIILGLCAGCGGTRNSGTKSGNSLEADTTITDQLQTYTLFAPGWQAYSGKPTDRMWQVIEKKFNIKLKFIGAPGEGWLEKLGNLINTGQVPDAFFYLTDQGAYRMFVDNDIILPLNGYLSEDTPYLKKLLYSEQFVNTKIDGKYYFTPLVSGDDAAGLYVRRDWMDKLGIETPKTMDEFASMLEKFTLNDPDGNGKDDTVGLAASKNIDWFWSYAAAFGVVPGWTKDSSGQYQRAELHPEYKDFLEFMANLYSKGYMTNEFFLIDEAQQDQAFYSGQTGCFLAGAAIKVEEIVENMKTFDSKANIDLIVIPGLKYRISWGGYWGGWSISSDAKEPYRLVKMLDYLISPEGNKLRCYGIENVHYSMTDGKYVPNFAERKKDKMYMATDPDRPIGNHIMGVQFGIEPFEITDKGAVPRPNYDNYKNAALVKKNLEAYSKLEIMYEQPTNYYGFPTRYYDIKKRLKDISDTYVIRIISGDLSVDQGLELLKEEFYSVGYTEAQQMVTEALKGTGK